MGMDWFQTQASVEQRRPDPSGLVTNASDSVSFVDPEGPTQLKPAGSPFPDDGWIQNDIIEQS